MNACVLLLIAQVAVFGSFASGQQFLDPKSPVKPTDTLVQAGKLRGRWRGSALEQLEFLSTPPSKEDEQTEPGYYGFAEDFFSISLPHSKVQPLPLHATYGTFLAYPMDVDGDGRDELFIEYGDGRGTSVYVRYLAAYKLVGDSWRPILADLPLNGYLWDLRDQGDPPSWNRIYSLVRKDGRIAIRLRLSSPTEFPKFIGNSLNLEALQFPRLRYEFNAKRGVYEIADFQFRRLP
jgi:hypothetical protein